MIVDDSHGVGAFGATGRGTEEHTGAASADILVATLGKALGVNGGYVVGDDSHHPLLARDRADLRLFQSDHAGRGRGGAAAVDILDSAVGRSLLTHLRAHDGAFQGGLVRLGFETLPGEHPVVPLMLRDTARTCGDGCALRRHGVLATGLTYPVVPKGDEEIRFQISADHTRPISTRCSMCSRSLYPHPRSARLLRFRRRRCRRIWQAFNRCYGCRRTAPPPRRTP